MKNSICNFLYKLFLCIVIFVFSFFLSHLTNTIIINYFIKIEKINSINGSKIILGISLGFALIILFLFFILKEKTLNIIIRYINVHMMELFFYGLQFY